MSMMILVVSDSFARSRHVPKLAATDEIEHITTRSLALARYKRNHEFMNEVFMQAAFGMHTFSVEF